MLSTALETYFPSISPDQIQLFIRLEKLLLNWNDKANVISRKNTPQIIRQNILHSTAIACYHAFEPDTKVLDLGTGGGLPGFPLAILFPQTEFVLLDSSSKKIKIVQNILFELGLKNVKLQAARVEDTNELYDIVVSKAVANADTLVEWSQHLINPNSTSIKKGIICLKGGDVVKETKEITFPVTILDINKLLNFHIQNFDDKKLVHIHI